MEKIQEATAEQIFASCSKPEYLPYDIPGAGRVYVRKISNLEFRQWAKSGKDDDELYSDASLIQLCVVDSHGQAKFTMEQITKIVTLHQDVMTPLLKKCLLENGIGKEAEEKIAKNLKTTPGKDS